MSNKFVCWLIFVALCFIWGSSFKLMRDSTMALNAAQIAGLRIFSAGLVFVPFAIFFFRKIPRNRIGIVILGAVFGNLLPAFLFALALTRIDGSLAGILNSLTPICVVVIGILFFKSKIQTNKIVGVLTGFFGLLLLTIFPAITGEKTINLDNLSYTLLIVLATLLYGINVNMAGRFLKGVDPFHAATVSLAFMVIPSGLVLLQQRFFQLDFSDPAVQGSIAAASGLGVAGSAIATVLFYILVKRAGGVFASLVTYGIPFIAVFWGFLDGEKITWIDFICLGIILVGVYVANRPAKELKVND
jgi:drug/metabolite transporter (DMT)-like permease